MIDMEISCKIEAERCSGTVIGSANETDKRPVLLFVLISILEHAEDASAEELGIHLFGPHRTSFAEQLLQHAERLGLVHRELGRWSLTST